jgi:hypothetical protein
VLRVELRKESNDYPNGERHTLLAGQWKRRIFFLDIISFEQKETLGHS